MLIEYATLDSIGVAVAVFAVATGIVYLAVCALVYRKVEPEMKRRGRTLTFEEVAENAKKDKYVQLLPQDSTLKTLSLIARLLHNSSVGALMVSVPLVLLVRTLGS